MEKPQEMRALVCQGKGSVAVDNVIRPKVGAKDVLVQVESIALNPTDWKSAIKAPKGAINGCDFAGTVVELGPQADGQGIAVGDRVAGMLFGSTQTENGAFAEYARHGIDHVWKIPSSVSSDEAAAFGGIAVTTAAQALYIGRLGLPWPTEGTSNKTICIWSGSSSVGQYAIQLAKASGLTVVTTGSTKNHELLKELGADYVYDYNTEGVESTIAKEHPADYGLDCFAEKDSSKRLAQCFGEQGGHIVTLLPIDTSKIDGWPSQVKAEMTLVYTTLGYGFDFGPMHFDAMPDDVKGVAHWHRLLPKLIEAGKIKPNKLRRCPGSLEKVHEGLEHMKAGKHSAEKLVYSVKDEYNPVPDPL